MKLVEKILRAPLASEILALLEKIDGIDFNEDEDEALPAINLLLSIKKFTRYERYVIGRALYRIERRDTLTATMHVVVKNFVPGKPKC